MTAGLLRVVWLGVTLTNACFGCYCLFYYTGQIIGRSLRINVVNLVCTYVYSLDLLQESIEPNKIPWKLTISVCKLGSSLDWAVQCTKAFRVVFASEKLFELVIGGSVLVTG